MRKEHIKELSPAAMRRRAYQLDEQSLELARAAQQLRMHANKILSERRKAKAARATRK